MVEVAATLVTLSIGAAVGAWFTRRNEKKATAERLMVEALNELVGGIADIAHRSPNAVARYASASARIALHGSPKVVQAFRLHQEVANTGTPEGRRLLVDAVQQARQELGQEPVPDGDLSVLLFGASKTLS